MKGKILIGTMARYFDISKQTLYHYDKVGVLKPVVDDENGYRYYTYEDVDKLSVILSLKAAGLTLEEIGNYLSNTSYNYSVDLLEKQITSLEEKSLKLLEAKRKIEHKLLEIEKENSFHFSNDIRLESFSERAILKQEILRDMNLELSISFTVRALSAYIDNHQEYYKNAHVQESVSLDMKSLKQGNFKDFSSAFVFIDSYSGHDKEALLKSGLYVCKHYKGIYANTHYAYKEIFNYIENEQLKIVGDALEIPVQTVWLMKDENEFVMEIQVPVAYI